MADRKSRAKSKARTRSSPAFHLDPERMEEIAAVVVFILAILTGLGAFSLTDGVVLTAWVRLLQEVFGWSVYITPLLLVGFGVWLLLDAHDRTINIGWERPIALALAYVCLLAILQWVSAPLDPEKMPGPFQGGGILGWAVLSVLIQAFGISGSGLALLAALAVATLLLFDISVPELVRHIGALGRPFSRMAKSTRSGLDSLNEKLAESRAARQEKARAADPEVEEPLPEPTPVEDEYPPAEEAIEEPIPARIIGDEWNGHEPEGVAEPALPPPPALPINYTLPAWQQILAESSEQEISQDEIRHKVRVIEETLAHFGVPARVVEVNQGPAITQFGVEPGFIEQKSVDGKIHRVKVKVSRITSLQHDLELAIATAPIRIEAPVPGRSFVGIEVPNSQISMVSLRSIVESEAFGKVKSKLKVALGQDVAGQPIVADLTTMPHLLIAGATGSGKSVCANSIVAALLCTLTPNEVRFVMVDPKRVELVNYNGIPHLIRPVVTNIDDAIAALNGAVDEMDRRYKLFAEKSARNIDMYNRMVDNTDEPKLPYYLVIVDELADLMMVAAGEVEHAITRLAQMARATGIHLILATQRPSVDVVTGLIKANFPARISFSVTSQTDSRVVLDTPGAEKLLGRGDMLYMASDSSKLLRLQGCYVSDRELEELVTHWKQYGPPPMPASEQSMVQEKLLDNGDASSDDDLFARAVQVIQQNNKASVSLLQRKLGIGYPRASKLMDQLEEQGIVGGDEGPTKGRTVLLSKDKMPRAPKSAAPSAPARSQPAQALPTPVESDDDDFSDWTDEDWKDLDKD